MKQFYLILISFFLVVNACKDKEITPKLTIEELSDTWYLESTSGSVTIDKKKNTIEKNSDLNFIGFDKIIFYTDGSGLADNKKFTYKLDKNTIIMIQDNVSIQIKASISNEKLILKGDKISFENIISILKAFGLNITDAEQTSTFTSLKSLIKLSGTPDCLLVKETISYDIKPNYNVKTSINYKYDSTGFVVEKVNNYSDGTKYTYSYEKTDANLGSDKLPYVKEYYDTGSNQNPATSSTKNISNELFCDKTKKVIKEVFDGGYFLSQYDNNNRFNKGTYIYTYDLESNKTIYEPEYDKDNNLIKSYRTVYKDDRIVKPKYLRHDFTFTNILEKTQVVHFFNYGINNKHLLATHKIINSNGNLEASEKYEYILDEKGYIKTKKTSDLLTNTVTTTIYTYNCR